MAAVTGVDRFALTVVFTVAVVVAEAKVLSSVREVSVQACSTYLMINSMEVSTISLVLAFDGRHEHLVQ